MRLIGFEVYNFRSVIDSGFIECDDVTTLIGINESGKSNLLLALWKLNPARGGDIDILHDMPVSLLSELRDKKEKIAFIKARFKLSKDEAQIISEETEYIVPEGVSVDVKRYYDGKYDVNFLEAVDRKEIDYTQQTEGQEEKKETSIVLSVSDSVISKMPKFVYYSNYGNLSARLYLPNVIKWMNHQDVPGIEMNEDQIRTLRVLFDFVKLDPQEILDLGKDPKDLARQRCCNDNPSKDEIEKAKNQKEERTLLLHSASGKLTKEFKQWWKQGEYKFKFQADGDYFTIWVSDSLRPDDVALELRSTGLQWFLSFFLIFLVESEGENKDAVLLLDEAGLTLHPMAQKDLALFFNSLSKKNQIVNTTHSPFVIDTDNIDRCRIVYSDVNGHTVASSDLRKTSDPRNSESIYAVHAALGLSVSDVLLQGCQPVIVEGVSDQIYLNAIKIYLIRKNLFTPDKDIIFMPVGGVRGVKPLVSLLGGKRNDLPIVVLDSDANGQAEAENLKKNLYSGSIEKIISISDICKISNSEIEDLFPLNTWAKKVSSMLNDEDECDCEFEDVYNCRYALLPQIEEYANVHHISLPVGYKVEIAKYVKNRILKDSFKNDEKYDKMWSALFSKFNKG